MVLLFFKSSFWHQFKVSLLLVQRFLFQQQTITMRTFLSAAATFLLIDVAVAFVSPQVNNAGATSTSLYAEGSRRELLLAGLMGGATLGGVILGGSPEGDVQQIAGLQNPALGSFRGKVCKELNEKGFRHWAVLVTQNADLFFFHPVQRSVFSTRKRHAWPRRTIDCRIAKSCFGFFQRQGKRMQEGI